MKLESTDAECYKDVDQPRQNFLGDEGLENQNQSESEFLKAVPCNADDESGSEACKTVKDRCIDERLAVKNLLETTQSFKNTTSGLKLSSTNQDDQSGRLIEDKAFLIQDMKITSVSTKDAKDQNSHCLFELGKKLRLEDHITKEIADQKSSLPLGDFNRVNRQPDAIRFEFSNDNKLHNDRGNIEHVDLDEVHNSNSIAISYTDSSQSSGLVKNNTVVIPPNISKDGYSIEKVELPYVTELNKCSECRKKHSENKNGDITSGFNVGAMITSDGMKSCGNTDYEQLTHSQNYSANEEFILDGVSSSSRIFCQNSHGDLNSTEPFYLSGPKASSSHIAFSGSISLRSDSSTTSTCSFAFPILQSEWNSSPVKMAKAEQRRKHWWRTALFCSGSEDCGSVLQFKFCEQIQKIVSIT